MLCVARESLWADEVHEGADDEVAIGLALDRTDYAVDHFSVCSPSRERGWEQY